MGKAAAWFQPHCGIPGITKKLGAQIAPVFLQ